MKILVCNDACDDVCCSVYDDVYDGAFCDDVCDKHVDTEHHYRCRSNLFRSHILRLDRNKSLKMRLNEAGLFVTHSHLLWLTI